MFWSLIFSYGVSVCEINEVAKLEFVVGQGKTRIPHLHAVQSESLRKSAQTNAEEAKKTNSARAVEIARLQTEMQARLRAAA